VKKEKKLKYSKFFENEADEGESEEEHKNLKVSENDKYSKEFLKAKAERLDHGMVDKMMKKYADLENLDDEEMQILEK